MCETFSVELKFSHIHSFCVYLIQNTIFFLILIFFKIYNQRILDALHFKCKSKLY